MARGIPTWLDCPPDGNVPNPPVETRAQGLPFNGLTWQNFERLILRLVRCEGTVLDCEIYGTPGQAQDGIDVLATPKTEPTKRICYQCKKVEEFDPIDIRKAVDAFLDGRWAGQTKEFVICVARPLESTAQVAEISAQRDRLQAAGISFVIWDGSSAGLLCEKLKLQPALVDDFFGRPWVSVFNGADVVAGLGQRLDAVDLGLLRTRMRALYTALFNQHDPGLRTTSGRMADYLHRYVLADVLEVSKVTPSQAEQAPVSSPTSSNVDSGNAQSVVPISTSSIYEARRGVIGWINDQQSCVVLGEAGYGKSALLRHLSLALLRQDDALAGQLDPPQLRRMPVWMSFAAFAAAIERNPARSVEDHFREWLHQNSFDDVQVLFERALRSSEVLLLVDGLDEAATHVQTHHALDRIVSFAQATSAVVVCTSRPRGFSSLGVPTTWANANLAALSDDQICELSARWFALTEGDASIDQDFEDARRRVQGRAEAFLASVRANARTHQLARIPLLCQTLIELFRASHRLPEEREAIYGEIITLLLSRHPDARARAAGAPISIDSLGIGLRDIREILIRLAWAMQFNGRVVISSADHLEQVCAAYLADDVDGLGFIKPEASRRAQAIVSALVSRFGLLIEKAPQELGFVHLSIQEFLAAEAVCRKTEDEQLTWIASIWMQPMWHECLMDWFGIQGARGKKVFAGQAANRIAELGSVGEFERMQALELRTELVCADIGLPINEARKIIHEASDDTEKSPFLQHRVALARALTIGALGSGVREECSALIRKWTPGRPSFSRAAVLSALEEWKPADDLQSALLQGLRDEEFICRRAAAQTIVKVFGHSDDLLSILVRMALHEIRPEVRASAVRALGLQVTWAEQALACANANLAAACAELMLETVKVRVKQRQHGAEDLQRMNRLWTTEAIDYWQRSEFYDVLFDGWPNAPTVREAFVTLMRDGNRPGEDDEQLIYLMRAYPGDDEIAELISQRLRSQGMHFASNKSMLWPIMRDSFRGHPLLAPALREALAEHRRQYEAIFWHPDTVGAYWVIGDDAARDELLASYGTEKDGNGKSWIARTLFEGWPNDEKVRQALNTWAQGAIESSAPLASFSRSLFANDLERRAWLEKLAEEGDARTVPQALFELLDQFPDRRGLELVRDRLKKAKIWYYHTVQLESQIAACAPSEPASQATFERSLGELDGPPASLWAASVENLPAFRSRILAATVPAPVEVRMAVVTTLRERMADYDNLIRLVPHYLAEDNGAVRATTMLALAQTARGDDFKHASFCDILTAELMSSGTYYTLRRRTALAGLLELGAGALAAETLEKTKLTHWTGLLVDSLHPDPVSLNTIVRHWNVLRPLLEARGLPTDLPVNEIVSAGYGTVLELSPDLKMDLDEYLCGPLPDWATASFLELLARRYPQSHLLRTTLIQALERGHKNNRVQRTIMRLLTHHFRADIPTLEKISSALVSLSRYSAAPADGILGYLASGWREAISIELIQAQLPSDRTEWGFRDRLLIFAAWNDRASAELGAREILAEPLRDWRYREEDTHILREWAEDAISTDVLQQWALSDNTTLSMTAISLMIEKNKISSLDLMALRERFNQQCQDVVSPPDGLDAVSRSNEAWCTRAYPALVAGISS